MLINKNVPLDVNLKLYGIYNLGSDGASGKTYAYKLFRSCNSFVKDTAFVCSADTIMDQKSLIKALQDYNGEYAFMDRADQYMTNELLEALKNKQKCFILLDLKDVLWWQKIPGLFCKISLSKDMVVLEGLY